jgi:hypothetical protein
MRSMRSTVIFLMALGLVVPMAGPLAAQKQKEDANARTAEGIVVDTDQSPVAQAVVQLKDLRTNAIRSFVTDAKGAYRFASLRTDIDYELKATFMGRSSDTKHLTIYDTRKAPRIILELKK